MSPPFYCIAQREPQTITQIIWGQEDGESDQEEGLFSDCPLNMEHLSQADEWVNYSDFIWVPSKLLFSKTFITDIMFFPG